MKRYMVLHFLNLYIFPVIEFLCMVRLDTDGDRTDFGMVILFIFIPTGCFLISFLYGLLKKEAVWRYCFLCPLLCIPYAWIDIITGDGMINRINGMLGIGCGYFLFAFTGSIVGYFCYIICKRLQTLWNHFRKN